MSLQVSLDTKAFTDVLDLANKEVRNACRRAVDKSARTARREAIKVLASDIGVPASVFRSAVPTVKASTAGSLSATWTISKKRVLIALTAGVTLPVRSVRGLTAATYKVTGGGSAALSIPKAFVMNVGGNAIVMVRRGKGRSALKPIYAESPVTGMSQADGAARRVWQTVAARELSSQLPIEVAKAFAGQAGGTSSGDAS